MSVVVRAASEADFDTLIWLNQIVQSLHAALYPGDFKRVIDPVAVRTLFATRLAAPEHVVGIAEADRVPVGYVWFEVQARPETAFNPSRPRIYVHNISVAPGARRRGVATTLMSYVYSKRLQKAFMKLFWIRGRKIWRRAVFLGRRGSLSST